MFSEKDSEEVENNIWELYNPLEVKHITERDNGESQHGTMFLSAGKTTLKIYIYVLATGYDFNGHKSKSFFV